MTTRILDFLGLEAAEADRLLRLASQAIVVIAIVGILLVVAGRNVPGQFPNSRRVATLATLSVVQNALQEYHVVYSVYPPDLQALVAAKIVEAHKVTDGWKRPLIYDPSGPSTEQPFLLISRGPDGIAQTSDDIDLNDLRNP